MFFKKLFGHWIKAVNYRKYYMLDFPLLWAVTYVDLHSSMKVNRRHYMLLNPALPQH